ncbi:MAG: glucose-6-phosphate isomerase [Luteitalea sp.]|nr:glucose-6-phosphate isomerase [Luteitalea sp.]
MHRAALLHGFHPSPGPLATALRRHAADAERIAAGLWRRDPAVWSGDAAAQERIANRLGWLGSPSLMAGSIGRVRAFAERVKADGFTHVVLLGMGGSSLAPEVLRGVLGVAPGWPALQVLDSTDPAAVRAVVQPPDKTLFLLASKSGTTIEPNSLAAHFQQTLDRAGLRWADHFVAITDPGTELAVRAERERFRDLFVNPADIGGRYSALSFFGLVPAALMGQDIEGLLSWAIAMLDEAQTAAREPLANPAVGLGLLIGAAAIEGHDKVTLVLPPAFEPFGLWVEQLVAESTGKQGVGVVPIAGEVLGLPDAYGPDRLFVQLHAIGETTADDDAAVRVLGKIAPLVRIDLLERTALGAEFMRWEVATAIAGALLGINPFDEPNVQQAKEATKVLLGRREEEGRLPIPAADVTLRGGVTVATTAAARDRLNGASPAGILQLVEPGDYVVLLAYLGPDPALAEALDAFRRHVRNRTRAATMLGYGPRYLHSTGQLHKGGPNTGVFVIVTATPHDDLAIPGQPFSFGTLELAQALGDFASLDATGRRAVHLHLPSPDAAVLIEALGALERSA